MITNRTEYAKAEEELHSLEERLHRLQQTHPIGSKGFTKAGIRKTIARLHEELAVYEAGEEARQPRPDTPMTDPIVAEIHRIRKELWEECHGSVKEMAERKRAIQEAFRRVLDKVPDVPPEPGDRLP